MIARLNLSPDESKLINQYTRKLDQSANRWPVLRIMLLIGGVIFLVSGTVYVVEAHDDLTSDHSVLQSLDSDEIPDDVPMILLVSGQSRKGLRLLELKHEMQVSSVLVTVLALVQATTGVFLCLFAVNRWNGHHHKRLLAKIIRAELQGPDHPAESRTITTT